VTQCYGIECALKSCIYCGWSRMPSFYAVVPKSILMCNSDCWSLYVNCKLICDRNLRHLKEFIYQHSTWFAKIVFNVVFSSFTSPYIYIYIYVYDSFYEVFRPKCFLITIGVSSLRGAYSTQLNRNFATLRMPDKYYFYVDIRISFFLQLFVV
jgi:hypothetical protein